MVKALVRFSLLLFLISAAGLIGLNRGLDPTDVGRIQAHDIIIELTSNNGGTLDFAINANCNSSAMAPSDVCIAAVDIENTGEGDYTLSEPDMTIEGPLTTCGGGGWFTAVIEDLSYEPDSEVIEVGDSESFNVVTSLDLDTPNDCQGETATIVIGLVATAIDDGEPDPTSTPDPDDEDEGPEPTDTEPELVDEVAGVQFTPAATASASPTPVATFISEVLPETFPNTGQGDLSSGAANLLQMLFAGIGLVAVGVLLLALTLARRKETEL